MVAHFKVSAGRGPVYEITRENVEELLGRRAPWFRQGRHRGDDRHYAVCPYCDTPIQLKGLYRKREDSPRPYGSHTGQEIAGLAFNLLDMKFCPYLTENRHPHRDARREAGPVAAELIDMAIAEFDRIVLILRDDFGFPFSGRLAGRMLEQWFDSQGYLYVGANLRNLPWMVAYFAPALDLFGQPVGKNAELADQIRTHVPQAHVAESGSLEKGEAWYAIGLQSLHHKIGEQDGVLVESMTLRVQDFTKTNEPAQAPTLYRKSIVFDPDRFERLIHTPQSRARRNDALLDLARQIAERRGFR